MIYCPRYLFIQPIKRQLHTCGIDAEMRGNLFKKPPTQISQFSDPWYCHWSHISIWLPGHLFLSFNENSKNASSLVNRSPVRVNVGIGLFARFARFFGHFVVVSPNRGFGSDLNVCQCNDDLSNNCNVFYSNNESKK